MDAEQLLKNVPLFQGLDHKHLTNLASMAHERSFAAGEKVFSEGESGLGMYVIVTGQAEIFYERGGQEERLRVIGPSEVFGEISLLVDHPRIASVRTLEPMTCLVLTKWSLRNALDDSPEVARHLLTRVAQWLVAAEDRAAARV